MVQELAAEMVEILLVEDNPGDVRLTQEAFKDAKVRNRLRVARDGAEALAILKGKRPHESHPRPDVVLLDLNLPGLNGFDVLKEMKESEELRDIPVVIVSSSKAEQDIAKSYKLQASGYATKPLDLDQFMEVIRSIDNFWVSVVKLPRSVAQ